MKKYTFFWKNSFSQWHMKDMVIDGIWFNCCEQYMMYSKAIFFGDTETAEKILKSNSPSDQQQLGRTVKNFDLDRWNKVCFRIVHKGNYAKFSQNYELKEKLLATGHSILVEASPYDQIWGIGMGEKEPGIEESLNWKGSNLLGFAITLVKQELLYEEENWKTKVYEPCVYCGELTPYTISDDINKRNFYVEGGGQLCEKCFNEIYNNPEKN